MGHARGSLKLKTFQDFILRSGEGGSLTRHRGVMLVVDELRLIRGSLTRQRGVMLLVDEL